MSLCKEATVEGHRTNAVYAKHKRGTLPALPKETARNLQPNPNKQSTRSVNPAQTWHDQYGRTLHHYGVQVLCTKPPAGSAKSNSLQPAYSTTHLLYTCASKAAKLSKPRANCRDSQEDLGNRHANPIQYNIAAHTSPLYAFQATPQPPHGRPIDPPNTPCSAFHLRSSPS